MLDKNFITRLAKDHINKIKSSQTLDPRDVSGDWIRQNEAWDSENKFLSDLEKYTKGLVEIEDPEIQFNKTKVAFMQLNLATYQLSSILMIPEEKNGQCDFILPNEVIPSNQLENLLKHYSLYEQILSKLGLGHDRSLTNAIIVKEEYCKVALSNQVIMECLFNIGVNANYLEEFNCQNIQELALKFGENYSNQIKSLSAVLNNDGTINQEEWSKLGNNNSSETLNLELRFINKLR